MIPWFVGLMVHGIESGVGLHSDSTEPAWDSLSPSAPPLGRTLTLSKSTLKKKKEEEKLTFLVIEVVKQWEPSWHVSRGTASRISLLLGLRD